MNYLHPFFSIGAIFYPSIVARKWQRGGVSTISIIAPMLASLALSLFNTGTYGLKILFLLSQESPLVIQIWTTLAKIQKMSDLFHMIYAIFGVHIWLIGRRIFMNGIIVCLFPLHTMGDMSQLSGTIIWSVGKAWRLSKTARLGSVVDPDPYRLGSETFCRIWIRADLTSLICNPH